MKTTVTIKQGNMACEISVNDQDITMDKLYEMIQQACLGIGYAPETVAKFFENQDD